MVAFEINGEKIGNDFDTYFIAEAGLNHNGDVKIAKKLIEEAHKCGANAVKFQTYKTEKFLSQSSQYFNFFKNVELSFEDFGELKDHAQSVGITFFSAPFDIESADYLRSINVPCFKIASGDLTNIPLIRHIAKMQKPVVLSTGGSTIKEIEEAVDVCMFEGNNKIALLHCVANYPTLPEETNLKAIITMKKKFNLPVGYSDNGESTLVDLVATSIGSNLIEKHFTLDKKMEGPDHFFSIDPPSLKKLILEIRLIEKIKGSAIKMPQQSEIKNQVEIRKSVIASKNIKKGELFSQSNLSIKRPANGIEPKYFSDILGKSASKDIDIDKSITWGDIN